MRDDCEKLQLTDALLEEFVDAVVIYCSQVK
jgi:hypothetical protein